jgi:hypothetical protein
MGFSPDIELRIEYEDLGYEQQGLPSGPVYGTLFGEAIRKAKYNVVEACLKNGKDVNKEVVWTKIEYFGFGEYEEEVVEKGTPWDVLSKHKWINDECRSRFKELFLRYGARIPSEA